MSLNPLAYVEADERLLRCQFGNYLVLSNEISANVLVAFELGECHAFG